MKLSRLPVLIRTEVTAAAKGASLPAVYSRALVALEEAVNELSFSKLKTVEISAEGLAAWAKAHQDEKLSKTARELKFRARRTANYIAEQLVQQRRAAFVARGGKFTGSGISVGEPEHGGIVKVLRAAGYTDINSIRAAAKAPEHSAHLSDLKLRAITRGHREGYKCASTIYSETFSNIHSPLRHNAWFRNNNARGIARQITAPNEIEKARRIVALTHAWCGEFLKNLPKTVSKARV